MLQNLSPEQIEAWAKFGDSIDRNLKAFLILLCLGALGWVGYQFMTNVMAPVSKMPTQLERIIVILEKGCQEDERTQTARVPY